MKNILLIPLIIPAILAYIVFQLAVSLIDFTHDKE